MKLCFITLALFLQFLQLAGARAGELDDSRQLILALAPDWNSSNGMLQRFERAGKG